LIWIHQKEFIVNNSTRKIPDGKDDKQQSMTRQSVQPDQQTWEGGRREPIHPDDIGADGEYLGSDKPQGEVKPNSLKNAN
jgi:hypothetical protein